jgi:hypothetical protein
MRNPRPSQITSPRSSLTLGDVLYVQDRLQAAMGYPCGRGEAGLKEHALALIDEVLETLHEINWKPWKRHAPKVVDRDRLLLELCDQLQFWGNQITTMGFMEEEVTRALLAKWQIGWDRIDAGEVTRAAAE